MSCTDCQAARETAGHWRTYNPRCIHCGARAIQVLRTTERRQAILRDWVAQGHSETLIRSLVASKAMAVEPVAAKGKK